MGQHGSKLEEPFAFIGNNVLNTLPCQVNGQRVQNKEWHDMVLDNPDFYHLEQDDKLAQDLAYIDQTYYKQDENKSERRNSAVISIRTTTTPRRRQSDEVTRAEGLQEVMVDQRTMPSVAMDLTGRSLVRLGAGIGTLTSLTQLNLSHNQIQNLPKELGNLIHLRVLNLSYNCIISLPDTMGRLARLRAFNASFNRLDTLPVSMGCLQELMILIVNNNAIQRLPPQLKYMKRLATFHIAHNPLLTSMPAEIADMPSIKKWVAEGCAFPETAFLTSSRDPPSLVETCARHLVKMAIDETTKTKRKISTLDKLDHDDHSEQKIMAHIPFKFWSYLATVQSCSVCNGPYFDTCIRQYRIVDRSGTWMTIDYRLCSLHWSTEQDRLLYTFGHRQVIQEGAVDDYATDMQRKLYLIHQQEVSKLSQKVEENNDGYYYCRLVPSHTDSLISIQQQQPITQIPGQKGGNASGSSNLQLFTTHYF